MATFTEFEATRQTLIEAHDEIAAVWDSFVSTRSPVAEDGAIGDDPVRLELGEARIRLDRALVEVGIFGDIKRGKSTLLNSLLGVEVSSTDVTPETAVPVYVEGGERSATVLFEDGSSEEVAPEEAIAMATQRYQARQKEKKVDRQPPAVVRVVQRVRADLLRQGVRLIDTPGLSDPSMSAVFEDLTLAELDRTAAAIIVFLYPPGIASNEIELLRSLDSRRVDKTFLVCNFYSGPWENAEVRSKVEEGIKRAIGGGTGEGGSGANHGVRLYSVNAGLAWESRRSGNSQGLEASGVARLARDLEGYLTDGALALLSTSAGEHLRNARLLASSRIDDRLALLDDPQRLNQVKAAKSGVVEDARKRAEEICRRIERDGELLGSRLADLAKEPFEDALAELAEATQKRDVEMLDARWRVRVETMISRLGSAYTSGFSELRDSAQGELVAAFQVDQSDLELGIVQTTRRDSPDGLDIGTVLATDWGTMALAAGAGALGGGALAGGAGMALLWFMGPIGWAVGAGIGALLAGGAAGLWDRRIPPDARRDISSRIQGGMLEAQRQAREQARSAAADLADRIRQLGKSFSADALTELRAVERFIEDPLQITGQRATAESLRERLRSLDL